MRIRALNFERCLTNMEEGKRQILLRVDSIASLLASQSTIWYWKTSTADHGCIQKYRPRAAPVSCGLHKSLALRNVPGQRIQVDVALDDRSREHV
jgi:hypothetical protein